MLNLVISFCKLVCEIALVLLVIMVSAEVLGRNIFGISFSGVEILAGYVLVLLTYLGGAVALSLGAVYRMNLVDSWLDGKKGVIINILVHLLAISFLLIMAFHACNLVESSFNRNITSQANPDIMLWPLQLAVPIGIFSMILVLSSRVLKDLTGGLKIKNGQALRGEEDFNDNGLQ